MAREPQTDAMRPDAQPFSLWLGLALSVEQKLKLHARSLKCRVTKTIPHCRIRNPGGIFFVVIN
jgi:hypothetical protein